MADVLTRIQQDQTRQRDAELAAAQHDLNWNTTFGRMAPDEVLRETRNMTSMINTAIERKMALAAQTSDEAQRIWINDRKFKAWEEQQPLRDELLRAQVADETASVAARDASELLSMSRRQREARAAEHTALAQWEMDELENAQKSDDEKRTWLNTVRGRYPSMDKDTAARHEALFTRLNPQAPKPSAGREFTGSDGAVYRFATDGKTTRNGNPIEDVPDGVTFKPVRYMNVGKQIVNPETGEVVYSAPAKAEDEEDSWDKLGRDVAGAKKTYGSTEAIPAFIHRALEQRGAALEAAAAGRAKPAAQPAATASPTKPSFAPGTTRVKNGVTYVRGEDGIWLPQS